MGICRWKYDEIQDSWETDCGNDFVLMNGTPADNRMQYCPYCGYRLEVIKVKGVE